MITMFRAAALATLILPSIAAAQAPPGLGTEEFGLSQRQLVQAIERTEELISKCMRAEGFQYIAADQTTVFAGMGADKNIPGLSEEEFVRQHGDGISTLYTGQPPQLATGYSPAKVGLGERNVQYFSTLSPADQVAYNQVLLGENTNATFAVSIEAENFSQTGGCTRKAIEQVFEPEQLSIKYYNPQDALINQDHRMKAALSYYAREMKKAGFEYTHPDEIETDLRARLAALTDNGRIPVEKMSPEQRASLKRLQDFERAVAAKSFKMQEEVLTPVEERIQEELFSRKVQ